MKRNASSSLPPFGPIESGLDFLGPIVPVAPPTFPRFPSVDELLQHQAGVAPHPLLKLTEAAPPSKPASLFEGLLGSNLEMLAGDLRSNPERYDTETREFLEGLSAGARRLEALTPQERAMLDSAVMDYAAFRPPRRAPLAPKPVAPKQKKPALLREEGELPDGREPQVDIPGDPMSAYWWV